MRRSVLHRLAASLSIAIGAVAALSPIAAAQVPCTGPDNLWGFNCCQLVNATLPNFTQVSLPGLGICWLNCQPQQMSALKVDWTPLVQVQCSQYVTQLTVTDIGSTLPILSGTLVLDYTRTWTEVDPSGNFIQVWRFAAKTDLKPVLVGLPPVCPEPSCLQPFGNQSSAFFYGYVDYATNCSSGITQNVLVLQHSCDFLIHNPALSSAPGVYHPKNSYAIVAPHSTVQPFNVSKAPSPSGPLIGEGTRDFPNLPGGPCRANDGIIQGQLTFLGGVCLCPPSIVPKLQTFRQFSGQTNCPQISGASGTFQALNIGFPSTLPWFYLTTTNIGVWTNPNVYPGKERAWVDEGLFLRQTGCSGDVVSIEYGGSTKDGWSILHPVLLTACIDIADNYTAPLFGPYPFPILGNVMQTDRVTFTFTP
jgi:hypothetical protein